MTARKDDRIAKDRMYSSILCVLLLFLSFLLSPYSPRFRYVYDMDAVCYRIMARGLLAGKIPYLDLFDHKGPLVHYIFSLGYFFSRNADWGAWIIVNIFNFISFIFCYKTIRVFRNAEHSFLATVLTIFISTYSVNSIFFTMSKPDALLLAPLMVSVYLFVKETHRKKSEVFDHISHRALFVIGLMCGMVFMMKLNICLFYLAFIGLYFLWLIIQKKPKEFFASVGVFLGGIAAVCLPIVLSMVLLNNLKEFFNAYIVYNARYSTTRDRFFYLSKVLINKQVKNTLSVFLLLTLGALLHDIKKRLLTATKILELILAFIVMAILTYSYVFGYFYIVFVPFYLYGTDWLSGFVFSLFKREKNSCLLPVVLSIILIGLVGLQVATTPFVPSEKSSVETKIEEYAQKHPQAQVLFLRSLCEPIYSNYLPEVPDFREFYTPPIKNTDLYEKQLSIVKAQKATVVVWVIRDDQAYNDSLRSYLSDCGYHEYQTYEFDGGLGISYFSMYVLDES